MEDLTQRFLRYNRILAADTLPLLRESPALIETLETALLNGKGLPTIIGRTQIDELSPSLHVNSMSIPPPMRKPSLQGPSTEPSLKVRTRGIDEAVQSSTPPSPPGPAGINIFRTEEKNSREQEIRGTFRPRAPASDIDGEIQIVMDPSRRIGTSAKVDDFRNLFLDRYRSLRQILVKQNPDLMPIMDISNLDGSEESVRFVGIVSEVRTTKNGHTMVALEDTTGSIRALIGRTKEAFKTKLVNDEVVAVIGKYRSGDQRGSSIVFADRIVMADVPPSHRRRTTLSRGILAAFTSDTHVGSRMYLPNDWERMVSWLRGERDSNLPSEMGRSVKYLVISGDLVDGIGVYPEQENDLQIKDISRQYEALAESLSRLPEHIELVLIPGNHDAVRLAEPQPPLPREFQDLFSNSRIHFLSNPTHFSISGVVVSAYHGKSLDDLVTLFKDVSYENPIKGMKEMLRMRHFSPCYGMRNQLSPEETDMLVINEVPDILVSGHVHRFEMDVYRGVQMVQGSTWQSQTPFQKLMNFKPQPSKMGVIDLGDAERMYRWELN